MGCSGHNASTSSAPFDMVCRPNISTFAATKNLTAEILMIVRSFYRMRDFRIVQQVWGLILSLTQHVSDYARMAADGSWTRNEVLTAKSPPIRELDGRIFGVVGWGELGRGAARAAEAFGMRVAIANRRGDSPKAGRVELNEL